MYWPILELAANISVALAITNLLPLPALDGGRIVFVLIEGIRGRRVDPQRETIVHFIGFAVLLAVMVVFVFLDFVDPLIVPWRKYNDLFETLLANWQILRPR